MRYPSIHFCFAKTLPAVAPMELWRAGRVNGAKKTMKAIIYSLFLIIFLNSHPESPIDQIKIIRAKYFIEKEAQERWKGLLDMEPLLNTFGLYFVDENPDIILCNKVSNKVLAYKVPIIILEKKGSASLMPTTRKRLSHPLVKAVFKNRILQPKGLYNKETVLSTYFITILYNYAPIGKKKKPKQLTRNEFNKIHAVMWDIPGGPYNNRFKKIIDYIPDFSQDRPIDIFFAGNITSMIAQERFNEFYNWHRTKAIQAIEQIPTINKLILKGKVLPFDEYLATMKTSKIVISPWGFGEWCYRDFETIHCGAILVKPDTSFVQSIPDIYQNNITYVPCKPDFSDLQEIVQRILNNYDEYKLMAQRAKEVALHGWDFTLLAKNFVDKIHKVLEN